MSAGCASPGKKPTKPLPMEFIDARRLTGPSLLFDEPGSILDVSCSREEAARLIPVWRANVQRMLAELDWRHEPKFASVLLAGGVSVGFTAPIDALYAASELNEWAWAQCDADLQGAAVPDFAATLSALQTSREEESNPVLLALEAAAAARDVTFLWDDDDASLGLGRHSTTWPVRGLPDPGTLDWRAFSDVPIALVTGTNGKTTTVRLAAHIMGRDGPRVGMSSTDYIAIGDQVVDRDDWAGPGGARLVLRHSEVDIAILETARGGLLRRGLGITSADAALITNIARDHLGDFGSQNLEELLNIKWIVSRAVRDRGQLVLNADDALLVGKSGGYPGAIVWFSLDPDNEVITAHAGNGGKAFVLSGEELLFIDGQSRELLLREDDIPITLGGAARHNTANALAAAALTSCLGASLDTIRTGLSTMSQDANPGRGNLYKVNDFTVIVDFAHNPQALQALLEMAHRLPGKRKVLCFGQAGDRTDDLIRELARDAWATGLDRVHVSELAKYYRGRGAGEVFRLMREELISCGATDEQIEHHEHEIDSLNSALAWAQPGDLVIMLALERSQELYDKLKSL